MSSHATSSTDATSMLEGSGRFIVVPHSRRLGRYELGPRISAGGMGTVYRATLRGTSGFARPVALKTLHPHLREDPAAVRRFLREARLGACVRHANVVPILDVDIDEEPFLVMELIEGTSLATALRKSVAAGKFVPVPIAVALASDMLAGLQAVHTARDEIGQRLGLVHLDISPQNVLVGLDGAARIADFGIARALELSPVTIDAGKIRYTAPEQFDGVPSSRCDIYSASIVLWETLTGANYRTGQTPGTRTGADLPPSVARPDVPAALDEVVMRGLRTNPEERFQTAEEMRVALERGAPRASGAEVAAWVASLTDREPSPEAAAATLTVKVRRPRKIPLSAAVIAPIGMIMGFTLSVWALGGGRSVVKSAHADDVPERAVPRALDAPPTSTVGADVTDSAPAEAPNVGLRIRDEAATALPSAATPARKRPAVSAPSSARPRAAKCASPYVLLPDGRKHFRLECLE